MEKNFKVSYDEIEDIFYLGNKEKVKFSIDLALPSGDIVIDIGFDGQVKGIEIFDASNFFSVIKEELNKIKNAELKMVYSPSYISISINLDSKNEVIKNNIIVPYNKKLIMAN